MVRAIRRAMVATSIAFLVAGCGDEGEGTATTTVPPPSTTSAPPTTTVPVTIAPTTTRLASREQQLSAVAAAFEAIRVGLADAIESDNQVDVASVDRLEFDQSGPTIVMNATSRYTTERILRDGAWAVTKSMQPFWSANNLASVPDVIPSFRLTLSTVRYQCSGAFMVQLAQLRVSRDDWESQCRL